MTKVLAVRASARRGGNSDTILERALDGVRQEAPGARIETLTPRDLSITPCRSCGGCAKTGRCVVQDEMQALYPKFCEADHIIVASPIYFTSLPGHMKVLVDRFQCFWVRTYVLRDPPQPRRSGMFLCVAAMDRDRYYQSTLTVVKTWMSTLNVGCGIARFYPGMDDRQDILRHEDYQQDARQAGRDLVRTRSGE